MRPSLIPITLIGRPATTLRIFAEGADSQTIFEVPAHEQHANNEAATQLLEGCCYEFTLEGDYQLQEISKVIINSKVDSSRGRIVPGSYVGRLIIPVLERESLQEVGSVQLEVRSSKLSYREDYRNMLEDISEYAIELLMQHSSPVVQAFIPQHTEDATTLYQRFAFVKSLIRSEEFKVALHRTVQNPVTGWREETVPAPSQAIRRIDRGIARQIASFPSRIRLPSRHPLNSHLKSIPSHLIKRVKMESLDTPENRFIKHALQTFANYCDEIGRVGATLACPTLHKEASTLAAELQNTLQHSHFNDISPLTTLPLNSPVLQRKEGYREVLRAWLLFDLAAQLVWSGGDDIYDAGKRDVAVLYEYWIFFRLLKLIERIFKLSFSPEQLLEKTQSGMGLKLKQGRRIAISGMFDHECRKLNVEFNYNKLFRGGSQYPGAGSWTKSFRPDYTLSMWPDGISAEQAEIEELIVHIHFDAKYRIENIEALLTRPEEFDHEDEEGSNYKRADLLKMHAYRDAIRRTGGAYILYPGETSEIKVGFHEILPGLGAFAIRPDKNETGEENLEKFLREICLHLLNRASHRERFSYRMHQIHSRIPLSPIIDKLPEPLGDNRSLLPSDTFVLVGYFKNQAHLDWIQSNLKYNVRTGSARGAMHITSEVSAARYLLLHTAGDDYSTRLFRLSALGPHLCSSQALEQLGYPSPRHDFYLLFDMLSELESELSNFAWDFRLFSKYTAENVGSPFTVTLEEMMRVKLRG